MTINLKRPKRIVSAALALFASSVLVLTGVATAIGEGQIEGGDIYKVKNVTKGTSFADSTSAAPCETVQFKLRLHNPGPGDVTNVHVRASLPSTASTTHVSTATLTAQNAQPSTRSDTATVNVSSTQKISYLSGSTQLLDTNSNVIRTLSDGITGSGVSIGTVGVSLKQIKFVQFKAKLDCKKPPQPKPSSGICKELDVQITDKKHREVKATVTGQVSNAEIVGYKIDFGDGTVVEERTATHRYAKEGRYTIVSYVQVKFADGRTEWKTAESCKAVVKFEKETPPKEVPPEENPPKEQPPKTVVKVEREREVQVVAGASTVQEVESAPTSLPKTGPADIAAAVIAASVLGGVFHRFFLSKPASHRR